MGDMDNFQAFFRGFFQVGINIIRPAEHGCGWGGGGEGGGYTYLHTNTL